MRAQLLARCRSPCEILQTHDRSSHIDKSALQVKAQKMLHLLQISVYTKSFGDNIVSASNSDNQRDYTPIRPTVDSIIDLFQHDIPDFGKKRMELGVCLLIVQEVSCQASMFRVGILLRADCDWPATHKSSSKGRSLARSGKLQKARDILRSLYH